MSCLQGMERRIRISQRCSAGGASGTMTDQRTAMPMMATVGNELRKGCDGRSAGGREETEGRVGQERSRGTEHSARIVRFDGRLRRGKTRRGLRGGDLVADRAFARVIAALHGAGGESDRRRRVRATALVRVIVKDRWDADDGQRVDGDRQA